MRGDRLELGTEKQLLHSPHIVMDDDNDDDAAHNAVVVEQLAVPVYHGFRKPIRERMARGSGQRSADPCGLGGELLASGELF